MLATFLSVALFATLAIKGARADLTIDTPALIQCQPVNITWDQTQGPYNLIVVPADDPCGDIIADLGDFDDTSAQWTPNITAGKAAMFSLEDAAGNEAWSGTMTIQGSNDSSCISGVSSAAVPSSSAVVSSGASTPHLSSSASSHASSSSAAVPVGAAGAGLGPKASGAYSMRQLSLPITIVSVLATIAISL
ncbi:hypothetical protein B0H21DRAFT_780267 [Amylocystis lapponica]|nr:hypothetical protein B0H21DRAFT_780267 [Amylocystis lapponica]